MASVTLPAGCRDCNVLCVKRLIVSPALGDTLIRLFSTLTDITTSLAGLDNGRAAPLQRVSMPLSKEFPSCLTTCSALERCKGSFNNEPNNLWTLEYPHV